MEPRAGLGPLGMREAEDRGALARRGRGRRNGDGRRERAGLVEVEPGTFERVRDGVQIPPGRSRDGLLLGGVFDRLLTQHLAARPAQALAQGRQALLGLGTQAAPTAAELDEARSQGGEPDRVAHPASLELVGQLLGVGRPGVMVFGRREPRKRRQTRGRGVARRDGGERGLRHGPRGGRHR